MSPLGPTTTVPSQPAAPSASYWDAPQEQKLQGKRLSKLSLSELGHVEYENEKKLEQVDYENDNEPAPNPTPTNNGSPPVAAPAASYWDAPEEQKLKGKRLSKLSLSELGHADHGNHEEPEAKPTTTSNGTPPAALAGSYWDAPEEQKLKDKRLSKLSLSELGHVDHGNHEEPEANPTPANNPTPPPAASYWDAPEEQKLKGKRLSKLSLSELGHADYENENEPEANPTPTNNDTPPVAAPAASYWDAPQEQKLQGKTLSTLSLTGLGHVEYENEKELAHVDYENDNEPAANPTPTNNGTPPAAPAASYWDAPEEQKLKGKRLSKLSLSELGHVDYENEKKPEANHNATPPPAAPAASYWDAPQEQKLQGKTLSTLSLTGLGHVEYENEKELGHVDYEEPAADPANTPKKAIWKDKDGQARYVQGEEPKPKEAAGGYWGWQENITKTLSKLSLSDLARSSTGTTATSPESSDTRSEGTNDGDKAQDDTEMKRRPSTNSFWFWPNSSMSNLQDAKEEPKTNSNDNTAEEKNKNGITISRRPSGAGGYWFWRNPSATNLTNGQNSDSTVSLETLEKNARASDRKEGKQGPITNLQHKMRSKWRASFKSLSSNTLTALDETPNQETPTKTKSGEGWQGDFSEKESNTPSLRRRDSFVVPEDDEDGMTF